MQTTARGLCECGTKRSPRSNSPYCGPCFYLTTNSKRLPRCAVALDEAIDEVSSDFGEPSSRRTPSVVELIGIEATYRYDDEGNPLYLPSKRILRALRWHDWLEPTELYDLLELAPMSTARNTHMKALERLINAGLVERRSYEHWSDAESGNIVTSYVRLAPNV